MSSFLTQAISFAVHQATTVRCVNAFSNSKLALTLHIIAFFNCAIAVKAKVNENIFVKVSIKISFVDINSNGMETKTNQ
jgi:hypothetical protein